MSKNAGDGVGVTDGKDERGTQTLQGSLYMVGTAIMFASAFVATKYTVDTVPPLLAAALRFGAAAAALAGFSAFQARAAARVEGRTAAQHGGPVLPADRRRIVLLGVLGIFAYHALFFWALQFTSASLSALIVPTTLPLATALWARGMLGERLGPYTWAGVAAATVGVVLAIGQAPDTVAENAASVGVPGAAPGAAPGTAPEVAAAVGAEAAAQTGAEAVLGGGPAISEVVGPALSQFAGPAALLVAVVCFAAYSVIGYGPVSRYGALRTTMYATIVGAVLLALAALPEWGSLPSVSGGAWAAIVFMGVGSSGLGLVWNYRGGALLGPGRAAGFLYLVPLFAVSASVVLLGETVGVWQLVGGACIVLGVVLVQLRKPASGGRKLVRGLEGKR